jgi:hypothetical protein
VKAVRDVDGDGCADILWQNAGGQAAISVMHDTTRVGTAAIGRNSWTSGMLIDAKDLNGDGIGRGAGEGQPMRDSRA